MLKALLLCALLTLLTLTPRAETDAAPAPRPIPWDCDTWAAFAHEDRTIQILESLAANRGKTLYCGVDQSDTFTKAETWEAGRDRNERDDTVYFGEHGQFRGFIAAQEGYLTEGESGVTGVSIDRIFEFPRETYTRKLYTKKVTSAGLEANQAGGRYALSDRPGKATTQSAAEDDYFACAMTEEEDIYDQCRGGADPNAYFTEKWGDASTATLEYCQSIGYKKAIKIEPSRRPYGVNDFTAITNGEAFALADWTATCTKLGPVRKNTPPT